MLRYFREAEFQVNKGKRWVVVVFTESNDYTVMPVNWLNHVIDDFSILSNVRHCVWPHYRVISSDLIAAEEPEPSWESYKIRIMHNEIYTDFEKAWYKKVELESQVIESDDMKTFVTTHKKPSTTQLERGQLTIQDLLSSSPIVNYNDIIGDGSVSVSPVSNNANNNILTVSPMTQSSTHLMLKDFHPEIEMVEIQSPNSNFITQGYGSDTNDDNEINTHDENKENNNE